MYSLNDLSEELDDSGSRGDLVMLVFSSLIGDIKCDLMARNDLGYP